MCGIIGFTGYIEAQPILLEGLRRLEYRGYDSAGAAVADSEDRIRVVKRKGRVDNLAAELNERPLAGRRGISHTRWATHGEPSDENSHPHYNASGTIALVHNGIIENSDSLRRYLTERGYEFVSQTDTEALAHMIDHCYEGDIVKAVRSALALAEGSYAVCVIDAAAPGTVICCKKDSPLVAGICGYGTVAASDIPAIIGHTRDIVILEDYETAVLTPDKIELYDRHGMPKTPVFTRVSWDVASAEKGGFEHFMLKEIHDGPKALQDTLRPRLKGGDIAFEGVDTVKMAGCNRIFMVACGTAYHACLVGKYAWERLLGIPIEADYASEFRYRKPPIGKNDLFIAVSQSGETADTVAALRLAKAAGAMTLALTNTVGSQLAREADWAIYTWAGPEIAVASTKAYLTQLACLYMLALSIGAGKKLLSAAEVCDLAEQIACLPEAVSQGLRCAGDIKRIAYARRNAADAYFIGRGLDYAVALEGSLKLKEITYVHSEAFAAGELKHGPIALLESGTLVIALATQAELYGKMESNLRETAARGAKALLIAGHDAQRLEGLAEDIILLPKIAPWLAPVAAVVPLQLFAYHSAVVRSRDVDKPRNLAKSVTVE